MATTSVEILVPEGCFAGTEFTVDWGDTSYNIMVPDGVTPGQLLAIELPALGEDTAVTHPTGTTQPVEIVVPDGCMAGMEFTVEWGGVSYSIAVPEGTWPGQPLSSIVKLAVLFCHRATHGSRRPHACQTAALRAPLYCSCRAPESYDKTCPERRTHPWPHLTALGHPGSQSSFRS